MAQQRILLLLISHCILSFAASESINSTNSTTINQHDTAPNDTSSGLTRRRVDQITNITQKLLPNTAQQPLQNTTHAIEEEEDTHSEKEEEEKESEDEEPTPSTEVDWNISYALHSKLNPYNASLTQYQAKFHSFHCKSKPDCDCQTLELEIVIHSIHRTSKPLSCDGLQMNILPGVIYQFHIMPKFNDAQAITAPSKTFFISQDLELDVSFFGLQLQIKNQFYDSLDMNIKQLSTALVQQLSELCKMKRDHISVTVQQSSIQLQSNMTQVTFIVPRMEDHTEPQIALEKARNLIYDSDTSLLSNIIRHSASIQPVAITSNADSKTVKSNSTLEASGFNYGSLFAGIVVILACCGLIAKYSPDRFANTVVGCKRMSADIVEHWHGFINEISNVSLISKVRSMSSRHQYDVLNLSEDGEMNEDESGIVLLNEVFQEENVAFFTREKYIQTLKDNWLTKTEQLKQLNKQDWTRFGIPQHIQDAVHTKLLCPDELNSISDISQELSYALPGSFPDEKDVDPVIAEGGHSLSGTDFSDF